MMWWNHHRNLHNKFPIGPLKLFTVKQSNCKSHQLVNICFVYGHKFHWTCMKCVDSAFSAKFNAILASCCNKQWPLCISLFSFHIYHPILPDGGFHPAACMLFEQSFSCTSIRYFFFHPWFKFSCTLFIDEMYNIFCVARMFGRVTNYMAKYFDFCTNSIKKAHFCGELSQTKWDVWWWCWWKLIIYSSCRIEQFVVDCDARGPTRNNFRCWIHLGLEKNSIFALSNGNPSNCIHPQLLQSYTMASDDATKTPQVWIDNRRKNDPNLF